MAENLSEYYSSIILKLGLDETSKNDIMDQFRDLSYSMNNVLTSDQMTELEKNYAKINLYQRKIAENQEVINQLKQIDSKESRKVIKELEKENKEYEDVISGKKDESGKIQPSYYSNQLKYAFEDLSKEVKKIVKDSLEDLVNGVIDLAKDAFKEMSKMASYDLTNTTVFNETAWNTAMNYGLTGAQGYAFNEAMSAIGVSGIEDLQIAMMSPGLQEKFEEYFNLYEREYEENKELAQATQEFQTEWKDFKREVMFDLMTFFSNNKEVIMGAMNAVMGILEGVMSILDWLFDWGNTDEGRSDSERIAATSDIISQSSLQQTEYNTSNNVNVNMVNNANDNGAWFMNIGSYAGDQIIKALGGD